VLATEFRTGTYRRIRTRSRARKRHSRNCPDRKTLCVSRRQRRVTTGKLLAWLDDEQRDGGPQGPSTMRSAPAWWSRWWRPRGPSGKPTGTALGTEADGTRRQWAELDYVPALPSEKKQARPRRYIGLRLLKPQGELFDDGHDRKHFAIVTNRTERGPRVIEWHREKAAPSSMPTTKLKNALAAGRLAQPEVRGERRVVRDPSAELQRLVRLAGGGTRSRTVQRTDQTAALSLCCWSAHV